MNWVMEHLEVLLAAAAAVAYWLTQRQARISQEEEERRSGPGSRPAPGEDPEATRRVQEEIRRRIAERSGGSPTAPTNPARPVMERPPAPPVVAPRPVAREQPQGWMSQLEKKLAEARARAEAAVQERMRREQESRRRIETATVARAVRPAPAPGPMPVMPVMPAMAPMGSVPPATTGSVSRRSLWMELRDRQSFRRAIVLREVLGPPVGMRSPESPFGR